MKIFRGFYILFCIAIISCSYITEDKSVLIGKNSAGIYYYIKENKTPKNRVYLQLVVKAGSLFEDDNQQGLAHFLEHMAFNGTRSYKENELVSFLESMGVEFGPELNAYTSYDETVYKLQIPDNPQLISQAINILQEWAFFISFDDNQIDKERGVILEEERARKSAESKASESYLKVLFNDTKYGQRAPIGKTDIIKNFKKSDLTDFYKKWYTPSNMGIFIVGDIDKNKILKEVENFNPDFKSEETNPIKIDVPFNNKNNTEKELLIYADKEFSKTTFKTFFRTKFNSLNTEADYRKELALDLGANILTSKIDKLIKENKSSLLTFNCFPSGFVNGLDVFLFTASTENKNLESGWQEYKQYIDYAINNITENSLNLSKIEFLSDLEKIYSERDKTTSENLLETYKNNFLMGNKTISINTYYKITKKLLKKISLLEIQENLREILIPENSLYVILTDRESVAKSEKELLKNILLTKDEKSVLEDSLKEKDFWNKNLKPKKVIKEKIFDKDLKTTTLILENGFKIIALPTNYKNNEILVEGFSAGGLSLVEKQDFYSGMFSPTFINKSGLEDITSSELALFLSNKKISYSNFINNFYEGFSATSTTDSLENVFKLIYQYFTNPKIDTDSYIYTLKKLENKISNIENSPDNYFFIQINNILYENDYRMVYPKLENLKSITSDNALEIFKNRFKLDDWTLVFVGNFNLKNIEKFANIYLGNIENSGRKENFKIDEFSKKRKDKLDKIFYKGKEDKSIVQISITGDIEYTMDNIEKFNALTHILDSILRDKIREELEAAYITAGFGKIDLIPYQEYSLSAIFMCKPSKVDELTRKVEDELINIANKNFKKEYLQNYIEIVKNKRREMVQKNEFWISALVDLEKNLIDKIDILTREKRLDNLNIDDIANLTKEIIKNGRKKFVLMPKYN